MAGTSDGTLPSEMPSNKPGILFVASKVLHPNKLHPLDFTDWYENTHIQEVQSTGGISGSQRYESLPFHNEFRDPSSINKTRNRGFDYDFVTVYNMPDLAFRDSPAFKGLDGQSDPREELLEGLFRQVGFLTRFAEEVEVSGKEDGGFAAPFVITVATKSNDPTSKVTGELSSKMDGFRRCRTFKIHENSLLSEWKRSYMEEPTSLAILEFDDVPETEILTDLEGGKDVELGFWRLRRDYQGNERTPKGWSPK